MPSRRRSRQRALQILYLWDLRRQPLTEAMDAYYGSLYSEESPERPRPDDFMDALVSGTVERVEEIDRRIRGHAENWRMERMPAVDRNILRLAIYEMLGWNAGMFVFTASEITATDEINASTTHLLIEGARLLDEARR